MTELTTEKTNFSNSYNEEAILDALDFAMDFETMPLNANETVHDFQLDLIKQLMVDYLRSERCGNE